MSEQVILYDLPSKPPTKGWSFNPWKVRMALNLKGIDYKTEWVEYPDLVPTLKGLGLPPNNPDGPDYFTDYTSPAIRYVDGSYGMDSWDIIQEIEKQYPTPSLHLDNPIVTKVREITIIKPLVPHLMPKVPRNLLNKVSADYFYMTREEIFGKSLQEMEREATDKEWDEMKPHAKEIGELLRSEGGPFFLGDTISYADVIFATYLKFLERLDEPILQRFLGLDPAFPKVWEASKQWLNRED